MTDYIFVDGQRCTPYMAYQIGRLKADFKARFNLEVLISSALRLDYEQINIFLARYVVAAQVRGRYVYDTRVWNGVRYYRISSEGTVAVPKTSNHEVQGTDGAVDIRDSGNTPGVTRANNERSNWVKANAGKYDMEPEGYNFNEPWHLKVRNIFRAVPGAPAGSSSSTPFNPSEEDDMSAINFRNPKTGVTYTMIPGHSITAHINAFGSRLTNYVNTGKWPASETNQDRFNAGLRDLSADHVTWMLPNYGFARFTADTLPTAGTVYADALQSLLDAR